MYVCLLSILTPRPTLITPRYGNLAGVSVLLGHHTEEQAVVDIADGTCHHLRLACGQYEDEGRQQDGSNGHRVANPSVFDADDVGLLCFVQIIGILFRFRC